MNLLSVYRASVSIVIHSHSIELNAIGRTKV